MLIKYEVKKLKTGDIQRKEIDYRLLTKFLCDLRSRDLATKEYTFEKNFATLELFKQTFTRSFFKITTNGIALQKVSNGIRRTKYKREVNFEKTFERIFKRLSNYLKTDFYTYCGIKPSHLQITITPHSENMNIRRIILSANMPSFENGKIDFTQKTFKTIVDIDIGNLKHNIIELSAFADTSFLSVKIINRCFYKATAATRYYRRKHLLIKK